MARAKHALKKGEGEKNQHEQIFKATFQLPKIISPGISEATVHACYYFSAVLYTYGPFARVLQFNYIML